MVSWTGSNATYHAEIAALEASRGNTALAAKHAAVAAKYATREGRAVAAPTAPASNVAIVTACIRYARAHGLTVAAVRTDATLRAAALAVAS